jgi:hypothetical protein
MAREADLVGVVAAAQADHQPPLRRYHQAVHRTPLSGEGGEGLLAPRGVVEVPLLGPS